MRLVFSLIATIVLITSACSTINIGSKLTPEYKGVDPRAQKLFKEYMELAKIRGINFSKSVSVGFKKINQGDVIGICHYGVGFREIDLDIDFWNNNSETDRLSLIFHELTHCYCGRDHDYSEGKGYPENLNERIMVALSWRKTGGERPGYWEDGCPTSLMHPTIPEDDCVTTHYQEYIDEMFNRCQPW